MERGKFDGKSGVQELFYMKGKRKSKPMKRKKIAKKLSKPHGKKILDNIEAPSPKTIHFKIGKHVCINCDLGKPLPGDLLGCTKYDWEMTKKVAREQRLCRE